MNLYTNPEELASAWRRQTDTAIESGAPPLLALGFGSSYQDSWLNLLALNRVAHRNLGPQNPIIIAGGDGWLWLLASFVWRASASAQGFAAGSMLATGSERRSGSPKQDVDNSARMVIYAGGDAALYAASRNIAGAQSESDAVPTGLDWSAPPTATRGADAPEIELLRSEFAAEAFASARTATAADDWLILVERWAGGLLALGLLIAGFLG